MNSFKKQCIELRKKDYSLDEIMKLTGRGKSSVYFHIKDIPLSPKKHKEIRRNSGIRARAVSAARRGVSAREYKKFSSWTPELVLLVAHLMFDGEILKKRCIYNNRSRALTDRVEKLMHGVYDFPPKILTVEQSGVCRLQYFNVELANFLYGKANELQDLILQLEVLCQREFIRAFFDDEGCMDVRLDRNLRRIRGYQKDKSILKLIQKLLKNFDIESKLQGKNEVVISGKENLKRFQKEINFSKGVRLNPRRSNSLWKKDIEKRELLARAIKSFKT